MVLSKQLIRSNVIGKRAATDHLSEHLLILCPIFPHPLHLGAARGRGSNPD
ncbi:unnamed protein product [Penicillium roqueforti FM164]|uniref:Genomic scaffold, ProqFM164S03 n=1 Tax=Penicillium roqueforti (strain FM164) TaxID=1365484 RepID=W6QKC8_PENRF|nr:unnamed protein product [Penicillium roqueforti FM164]